MPIITIGLSHRTCAVDVRERFAFSDADIPAALTELKARGLVSEGVIVSTCNRMEIYAVTNSSERKVLDELRDFIVAQKAYNNAINGEFYLYSEPQSLEHLFKVACGMDSMLLGETEILGQLKKAYDLALQHKHTGARLNKAFQRAFNVAKHVRTATNIQRGSVSVASAAVELAEKIFNTLEDHKVMVIGAGDTSEKTARALLSRGAQSVIVANRSFDRAAALALELGGTAVSFDNWTEEFQDIDIVISSTAAPHYILDRTKLEPIMKARRRRPLLLIDIAVPRDIEPEVNFLESVYLYNIDDLQAIADGYLKQRQEEIAKCEAIIREKAQALLEPSASGMSFQPNLAQPA